MHEYIFLKSSLTYALLHLNTVFFKMHAIFLLSMNLYKFIRSAPRWGRGGLSHFSGRGPLLSLSRLPGD